MHTHIHTYIRSSLNWQAGAAAAAAGVGERASDKLCS